MTPKSIRNSLMILAWATTLLISLLPDILFKELTGSLPSWLYGSKVGLVGGLLLVSLLWKPLRALGLFFAVLLAVYLLEWGVDRGYQSLGDEAWFAGQRPFLQDMFSVQVPRATIGILLVLIMLILVRRFDRFFFVKGKLDAQAAPIPLILTRPPSWRILGPAITGAMCLGLLVFIFAFGKPPSMQALKNVLPLLPFVFLFAARNAFGEEMLYRATWLGALEGPVGPVQALLMTAVYFGMVISTACRMA